MQRLTATFLTCTSGCWKDSHILGGSRGKSLDWYIERTDRYLQSHPETDPNEMLKLNPIWTTKHLFTMS